MRSSGSRAAPSASPARRAHHRAPEDTPFVWLDGPRRHRRRLGGAVQRTVRWLGAFGAAIALAAGIGSVLDGARATRAAFGAVQGVTVAVRDLDPGTTLTAADVETRDLPAGLVPAGWVADPVGRTVTAPVLAGEPLVDARLAPAGVTGTAARLEPDERAVAVPREVLTPELHPGDTVDVVLGGDGLLDRRDGTQGRVLEVGSEALTIAVPQTDAEGVALAAIDGHLAVLLAPPQPPPPT